MSKGKVSGYGLIGNSLSHSWSAEYFLEKFRKEKLSDSYYRLFPLENIAELTALLKDNLQLIGLNVTIPFKEKIIPFLDELDPKAREIGAVNAIRIKHVDGKPVLKGYNTDADGFILSADFTGISHAYILGTGGACRAVAYALKNKGMQVTEVSRTRRNLYTITYQDLQDIRIRKPALVVNTTPLGMYPDIRSFPEFPYDRLSSDDFLYDLVYNPEQTLFLMKGKEKGTRTQNGLKMLQIQAEKSYAIWNSEKP